MKKICLHRRATILAIIIMFTLQFSFAIAVIAVNEPVIIKISEGVKPGETISVYGSNLTGTVKMKFVEASNRIVDSLYTDSNGQCSRFIMPSDISAMAYSVCFSNNGGSTWSNTYYLNVVDTR